MPHSDTYPFIHPSRFTHRLTGQSALITGASRGIGPFLARAFALAGANVVCLARNAPALDLVVASLNATLLALDRPNRAFSLPADLLLPSALPTVVARARALLAGAPIDILVNNAGISRVAALEDELDDGLDRWWAVVETNLRAPVVLTRLVLPGMLARGHGAVVTLGSRNACVGMGYMTAYGASKTAVLRFHECLELEITGRGVRTFVLQPGDVATGLDIQDEAEGEAGREGVKVVLEGIRASRGTEARLVADTCVALVAMPEAAGLSGLFVDAEEDLERMLEDVARGEGSRIRAERLYRLGVDVL
jgi:NAD(P)-dependent dehydrogenase (short-subunit alcohol dehydrogenase family)